MHGTQEENRSMARFHTIEDTQSGETWYHITDDRGQIIQLSSQQAYELLEWLYQSIEELHTQMEDEDEPGAPTQHLL